MGLLMTSHNLYIWANLSKIMYTFLNPNFPIVDNMILKTELIVLYLLAFDYAVMWTDFLFKFAF